MNSQFIEESDGEGDIEGSGWIIFFGVLEENLGKRSIWLEARSSVQVCSVSRGFLLLEGWGRDGIILCDLHGIYQQG